MVVSGPAVSRQKPLDQLSTYWGQPQSSGGPPVGQRLLGRAEAKWRAARAYVYETVDELWQHQLTGRFVTVEHAIDMQLACAHALESTREVTESLHEIGPSCCFRGSFSGDLLSL